MKKHRLATSPQSQIITWVARAQQGDHAAFGALYREHRSRVACWVRHKLGPGASGADVEDLVQDVFVQVFRSLRKYQRKAKFTWWLYRVAVNVVLMHRRTLRRRPKRIAEPLDDSRLVGSQCPDFELRRKRRIAAYNGLLAQLGEDKRNAYLLSDLAGKPSHQVAAILDCPAATVRTRLFHARRELSKLIADDPQLSQLVEYDPRRRKGSARPQPADDCISRAA